MDDEYRLGWEVASEQILIDLVTLFLTVATVWIVWYVAKTTNADEVKHLQFFLTFIIVIVPFVILIYFGGAVINYNAIAIRLDRPEVLPLNDLFPTVIVAAAAFYIGQTVWLWWSWRRS